MEHDARYGVHHRGECSEGQNVARDFNGALFCRTLNFLDALGMRHRADVPDVAEDFARVSDEERGEFAVILPSARHRMFIDGAACRVKEKRFGWNVGLRAVEADVALALLLRIVKRMRMQKRP